MNIDWGKVTGNLKSITYKLFLDTLFIVIYLPIRTRYLKTYYLYLYHTYLQPAHVLTK